MEFRIYFSFVTQEPAIKVDLPNKKEAILHAELIKPPNIKRVFIYYSDIYGNSVEVFRKTY